MIMKERMDYQTIETLIEAYFDGETTVKEERKLHRFFQQKNLPEQFRAEKAMFDYFAAEKAAKTIKKPIYRQLILRWSSVAAVVAIVASIYFHKPNDHALMSSGNYMIRDGVVSNDPALIRQEAMNALEAVSSQSNETATDEAHSIMLEQLSGFDR